MAGLFDSPEEIKFFENQRSAAETPRETLRGTLFNLGSSGGDALQRYFGGDPRSPKQRKSDALDEHLRGMDLTNRGSVLSRVQKLGDMGWFKEAAQLMQYAPEAVEPAKVNRSFQDMPNMETGHTEKWLVDNDTGEKIKQVGLDALKKVDPKEEWQSKGTVKLPNGTETSLRFSPTRQGIDALQVRIGDRWITAPAGIQQMFHQVNREPPKAGDPTKLTVSHAAKLIKDDDELGGYISGLSDKDVLDFATRVSALAQKLVRDKKGLDKGKAMDHAFLLLKKQIIKSKSIFGYEYDRGVMTPEEQNAGQVAPPPTGGGRFPSSDRTPPVSKGFRIKAKN